MPIDEWKIAARDRFRTQMWALQQRQRLPLSPEFLDAADGTVEALQTAVSAQADPAVERAETVHLDTDEDWLVLHRRFTFGSTHNCGPWNRCLSLLRHHGGDAPVTCVIEQHYVCLDYKSELVAFYAQLDQARQFTTTRLHFFAARVDAGSLHNLTEEQKDTYLGYIVCRDGSLPLVGRAVIKVPDYIDTAVAVADKVHFYGQDLVVHGMPFMQQDAQFAVCAQVAVWAIHYAAFRSGLVNRKLVAEIVALSGVIEPMKPRLSDGLGIEEAALLHRNGGLSATIVATPNFRNVELPPIPLELVPAARPIVEQIQQTELAADLGDRADPEVDVALFCSDYARAVSDEDFLSPPSQLSSQLLDTLLFHIFEPYLASNTPIYAGTEDHAVVLCGLSEKNGNRTFFVHDDQYGPYLALDALMSASRDQLIYQGYWTDPYPAITEYRGGDAFPADRTQLEIEHRGTQSWNDVDRAVHAFVVGGPTRLVLSPADAENACYNQLPQQATLRNDASARPFRSTIMMGIDFKLARCKHLNDIGDDDGAQFYANLHLSEWVIVVEDADTGGEGSDWEVVFDGSSSSRAPIVQVARFGDSLVASHPLTRRTTTGNLTVDHLPTAHAPDRVGKG